MSNNNPTFLINCLFPVAGHGTRFLPVTKAIPKEMLPILATPILQYGVEEAMSASISKISIVTNKNKEAIEKYFSFVHGNFENSVKNKSARSLLNEINYIIDECEFHFTEQSQMLGLGHAIFSGRHLVGSKPFAVILPDDVCVNDGDSVLAQMSKVFENNPSCCIVAIEEVPSSEVSKYGIVDGEKLDESNNTFIVNGMIEKPKPENAPSNLAIIGRYILTPEIFDVLESITPDINGEIQITDALNVLAEKGRVIAYKFEGRRFDCGNVKGYIEANNYFAKIEGIL